MTGALTAEIQALMRPELDELFDVLGQTVEVFRAQARPADPGALPPPDLDESGMPVAPLPADPTPGTPGAGVSLGSWPCIVYQLDAQDRANLGGDTALPLWEGVIHWGAPLHEPGLILMVSGGELPGPVTLKPIGDIVDEGTQRVAWSFTARATAGRSA